MTDERIAALESRVAALERMLTECDVVTELSPSFEKLCFEFLESQKCKPPHPKISESKS